jgi:hypothetical protein
MESRIDLPARQAAKCLRAGETRRCRARRGLSELLARSPIGASAAGRRSLPVAVIGSFEGCLEQSGGCGACVVGDVRIVA